MGCVAGGENSPPALPPDDGARLIPLPTLAK
jgi:hypothetical protein